MPHTSGKQHEAESGENERRRLWDRRKQEGPEVACAKNLASIIDLVRLEKDPARCGINPAVQINRLAILVEKCVIRGCRGVAISNNLPIRINAMSVCAEP